MLGAAYTIQASIGNRGSQTLGTVTGNTFDAYGLTIGSPYSFKVTALSGNKAVDQSTVSTLAPYAARGQYNSYDNTRPSSARLKSGLFANGVYYQYNYVADANGFSRFVEQTSSNGYDFSGNRTVLTANTLCKPAQGPCKLERTQWRKHPGTGEFVLWAHYEKAAGYGLGWVAVAHTRPGAQQLTFEGAYRPNNQDSRDMTFFADGNDAYLVTSTKVNTDNNIYRLNPAWTAVQSFLVQVNVGGHREAPSVIKSNGWFYLFTSRASGWLPSAPQYIAAQSMRGPWSNPFSVANSATFSAQSGVVNPLSSGQIFMSADRWSNNWPTKGGPNRQLMLPISESQSGGYASYHFYPTVRYNDDITTRGQGIYGVQTGKILSVNKPATCSAGNTNIALANDGIQDNTQARFVPSAVPFSYVIDLRAPHVITQVDLTTKLVQGSEAFYRYTVSGSTNGNNFSPIADMRPAVDVGFSAAYSRSTQQFRYVRIDVSAVINNGNGNAANWAVGINEVTVYGI